VILRDNLTGPLLPAQLNMLHCPTCGKQYPAEVQVCPIDDAVLQADPTVAGDLIIDPLLGQTLDDKYRLEARLGVGGMGTVYRARHVLIDRAVAVKVLNPRYGEDEAARERFRREAKAAGRLQHTNAVSVTDFGETSAGFVYIVMELLEGRTLREIIAKEAPIETARSVSIMLQASAAVAAAHDAGIIHRDLKPANIFVVQRSDVPVLVKVLDFGIAKLAVDSLEDEDSKTLTQIGAMIGTPRYMSPEQCSGLSLTPAADVYSLGVILYEMLTGAAPFSGSSPLAIAMKHAADLPRNPREIVSAIPEQLEQVVLKALEKRPIDRPADANAFRLELLDTVEKLGLEHFAVASNPDLKVLRDVGTQSPSGRLIVDISRLRESRILTSGSSELTIIREPEAAPSSEDGNERTYRSLEARQTFPRVNVELKAAKNISWKPLLALLVVIGSSVIIGAALFGFWLTRTAPAVPNSNAAAIPSPTVQLSPSPSPSAAASPSPKREASKSKPSNANNENANTNSKKKGTSFFGKIKKLFKG
jgi:eukaryotic-like serine/threonine-protein kinase